MPATIAKPITAERLLKMGGNTRCELVRGKLIQMNFAGVVHGLIAMRIGAFLGEYVDRLDLGAVVAPGTAFKIDSNPDSVRAPDASFIRKDRLPAPPHKRFFDGVPDRAVEVISPDDTKREVSDKTNMWFAHGTTSVWVADPAPTTITIYRTGKPPVRLGVKDELRDEPALPGFVMPLSKVFQSP